MRRWAYEREIHTQTGEKKMTKKDYELIARSIFVDRETVEESQKKVVDFVAKGLAHQLKAMNPRFDSIRFLIACGAIEK